MNNTIPPWYLPTLFFHPITFVHLMSGKIPAARDGFKSPAPVLPAMGLHSFHNDSQVSPSTRIANLRPPFAPASQHGTREPDHLSLDSPSPPETSRLPVKQTGFAPLISMPSRPASNREATSSADEFLSTSRSRRLVSGYLFGQPPDDESVPPSPTREHPPPPSLARDSPPVSNVSSSPEDPPSALETHVAMRNRRSSRLRDKETGYDALTGLSDGEADADANAPQAAFGTQEYLLGAPGEAGAYRFPRHRLRTRMKGRSIKSE